MPVFTASYTASQSTDGKTLTISDNSVYTSEAKSTFTGRTLKIYRADGTLWPNGAVVPFSFAAYPSDSIVITGIDRDWALNVQLVLTKASPVTGSIYTATGVVGLTAFTTLFKKEILVAVSSNPTLTANASYYRNMITVLTESDNAANAVLYSEQASAQRALDIIQSFISNKSVYF